MGFGSCRMAAGTSQENRKRADTGPSDTWTRWSSGSPNVAVLPSECAAMICCGQYRLCRHLDASRSSCQAAFSTRLRPKRRSMLARIPLKTENHPSNAISTWAISLGLGLRWSCRQWQPQARDYARKGRSAVCETLLLWVSVSCGPWS
jgi:hypothetical protein